jgi:hypothetical protein
MGVAKITQYEALKYVQNLNILGEFKSVRMYLGERRAQKKNKRKYGLQKTKTNSMV